MTEAQLKKQERSRKVWAAIQDKYPRFNHSHDFFDDPWMVETLVLGDFIGWLPFPGAKVMDIGANSGIWSAFCAVEGADVTAYEADPYTYRVLLSMAEKSQLKEKIKTINTAIWKENGTVLFSGDGYTSTEMNTIGRNGAIQSKSDSIFVPSQSLESAIGGTIWDCIKMDIEGAEFETLLSTPAESLQKIKFLQIEFHIGWTSLPTYERTITKLEGIFSLSGPRDPANRYYYAQCSNLNRS